MILKWLYKLCLVFRKLRFLDIDFLIFEVDIDTIDEEDIRFLTRVYRFFYQGIRKIILFQIQDFCYFFSQDGFIILQGQFYFFESEEGHRGD